MEFLFIYNITIDYLQSISTADSVIIVSSLTFTTAESNELLLSFLLTMLARVSDALWTKVNNTSPKWLLTADCNTKFYNFSNSETSFSPSNSCIVFCLIIECSIHLRNYLYPSQHRYSIINCTSSPQSSFTKDQSW